MQLLNSLADGADISQPFTRGYADVNSVGINWNTSDLPYNHSLKTEAIPISTRTSLFILSTTSPSCAYPMDKNRKVSHKHIKILSIEHFNFHRPLSNVSRGLIKICNKFRIK